jgi:hypothetical protein
MPGFHQMEAIIEFMRREIARQERRWRLLTGHPDTGELDRAAFYLDVLQNLFTIEDLRDICFDMRIDYESLHGETKKGKARELTIYCERHGRLDALYGHIRVARPELFSKL